MGYLSKSCISFHSIILGLAIILVYLCLDFNMPLTTSEHLHLQALQAYINNTFFFYSKPFLPSLITYVWFNTFANTLMLSKSLAITSIRHVNLAIFTLTLLLVTKKFKKTKCLLMLLFFDKYFINSILTETETLYSLLFMSLSEYYIDDLFLRGIFLGTAISCNFSCLAVYFSYSVDIANAFHYVVNPKHSIALILTKARNKVVELVLLPFFIYLLVYQIRSVLQSNYSLAAQRFTIEYQASLKHHTSDLTDRYVMDRSKITLLNKKHKSYLNLKADVLGGSRYADQEAFWTIIKIYLVKPETEEERFIKNGDFVKLMNESAQLYLSLENGSSDDKFTSCDVISADVDAKESDLWRVECDKLLAARSTVVKFVHNKTGKYLGMRRLNKNTQKTDLYDYDEGMNKKSSASSVVSSLLEKKNIEEYSREKINIHGSVYGAHDSRLFYVSNNSNHSYFKEKYNTKKATDKSSDFPALGFLRKFVEFHKELLKIQSTGLNRLLNPRMEESTAKVHNAKDKKMEARLFSTLHLTILVLNFIFPLFLVINCISESKYNICIFIEKKLVAHSVNLFGIVALCLFFNANSFYLYYFGFTNLLLILEHIMEVVKSKNRVVKPEPHKLRKKIS